MSKLILFDVDGVIVDSFDNLYKEVQQFVKDHGGKSISADEYRQCFEGNVITNVLQKAGLKPEALLSLESEATSSIFAGYNDNKLFKGIKEVLGVLVQKYILGVVTSTWVDVVSKKFKQEGIDHYFETYLGPKVGIYKDQKIKMALEKFNIPAQQAYFISDTSGDLKEAKKVGVKTVAVTWGYHDRATLEKASPDAIVEAPHELLAFLNQ